MGWEEGGEGEPLLPDTAFAWAYQEAEDRKERAEAARAALAEKVAAELAELHIYDPLPFPEAKPHEPAMYEGTGIGALYGLPGCERFLPELGDWKVVHVAPARWRRKRHEIATGGEPHGLSDTGQGFHVRRGHP